MQEFILLLIGSALTLIGMIVQHRLSLDSHRKNLITTKQLEIAAQVAASFEEVKNACVDFLGAVERDNLLSTENNNFSQQCQDISESIAAIDIEVKGLLSDLQVSITTASNTQFDSLAAQVQTKAEELESAVGDMRQAEKQLRHISGMKNKIADEMRSANQRLSAFRKTVAAAILMLPDSLHLVLDNINEATSRVSDASITAQRDEFLEALTQLSQQIDAFVAQVRKELIA